MLRTCLVDGKKKPCMNEGRERRNFLLRFSVHWTNRFGERNPVPPVFCFQQTLRDYIFSHPLKVWMKWLSFSVIRSAIWAHGANQRQFLFRGSHSVANQHRRTSKQPQVHFHIEKAYSLRNRHFRFWVSERTGVFVYTARQEEMHSRIWSFAQLLVLVPKLASNVNFL